MASATMTRMLVLGVVNLFEPVNGYQIRRELLSWGVEEWADLKPGSVYSMLATLTKQQLVLRYDLPEGSRTVAVYELSEPGREHFLQLVAAGLADSATLDRTLFKTALSFAALLPRAEVVACVRTRIRHVTVMRADLEQKMSLNGEAQIIPPIVVHSLVLEVSLVDAELRWLRDFVVMLEAGALDFAGESDGWAPPPDDVGWEMVDQSRRYREQIAALGLRVSPSPPG